MYIMIIVTQRLRTSGLWLFHTTEGHYDVPESPKLLPSCALEKTFADLILKLLNDMHN